MEFGVLGPLVVGVDGAWMTLDAPKQRMILGVLLARAGRVVGGEQLLELVWSGQPPAGGLGTLRYHVSKVRDSLAPGRGHDDPSVIRTVGSGYQVVVEAEAIDSVRFERSAADGAEHLSNRDFEAALQILDSALGLWRGEAWEDFRYEDFAQPLITRLEEIRLAAVEDRIDARLGRGEHLDLVPDLQELTSRYPLRERLWMQLMLAYYRAGRAVEAAAVYDTACTVLGEELGVEPNPALQRLHRQVIDRSLPFRHQSVRNDPLPLRTSSFVGRAEELGRLQRLIQRRRLVTVVGTGGVGKTSLALESVRRLHDVRVAFVDLSSVSQPGEVVMHVARSCGVDGMGGRPTVDDIVDCLADPAQLLVVDNCEHVVDAIASVVASLLQRCPSMTVLATSRAPLHVDGEHVVPIEPLTLPTGGDIAGADETDAVRLFVDRAGGVRGDFVLDDHNRSVVIEACRRLDGLPLALELAAARLRVLSVEELLDHLAQPFTVLVDQRRPHRRHRSLQATIEWSHGLLTTKAQAVLRRLSVLRGRFELATAATVCSHDPIREIEVLSLVEELVEASFVVRENDRTGGLSMLETIREFSRQQLDESGEADVIRSRHAAHFAGRAAFRPRFGSSDELQHLRQLSAAGDDIRAALDWSLQHGRTDLATKLAAGLALRWYTEAGADAALRWLVTKRNDDQGVALVERAEALRGLGLSLPWMGRGDEALLAADELTRIADHTGLPELEADALWVRASAATAAGDIAESTRCFDRGVSVLRSADHPKLSVFLFDLGTHELWLGNRERAGAVVAELAEVAQRWDQPLSMIRVRLLRGLTEYVDGDVSRALTRITQSLGEMRALGLVGPQVDPLRCLCDAADAAETWDLAERAANELTALLTESGEVVTLPVACDTLASVALARGDLDGASREVERGLVVIQRTGAAFALDHALLAAARVARARGRPSQARSLHSARARRCRARSVVDSVPVARLIARETQLLGEGLSAEDEGSTDRSELIALALDAIAT